MIKKNAPRVIHGESKTVLFRRWQSMHCRVKPSWPDRESYYDKGITVCTEWNSFIAFREWALNNGFSPELELDRKNNNLGYSPDNCRFVDKLTNNSNRSNTVFVNYKGERISLTLFCKREKIPYQRYNAIRRRIKNGWDPVLAIDTPIRSTTRIVSGCIPLVDYSTGEKYPSIKSAADQIGISKNHLSAMLKGKRSNHTMIRYDFT